MTRDEYGKLPGSSALPLYGDEDPRCEQIDSPQFSPKSSDYLFSHECVDLTEAVDYQQDKDWEFIGGIICKVNPDTGAEDYRAYFWKKR